MQRSTVFQASAVLLHQVVSELDQRHRLRSICSKHECAAVASGIDGEVMLRVQRVQRISMFFVPLMLLELESRR